MQIVSAVMVVDDGGSSGLRNSHWRNIEHSSKNLKLVVILVLALACSVKCGCFLKVSPLDLGLEVLHGCHIA